MRVISNDDAVDLSAIGRVLDVEAHPERVTASAVGQLLATHEHRWAMHQIFTDPEHMNKAFCGPGTKLGDLRRALRRGRRVNGAGKDIHRPEA